MASMSLGDFADADFDAVAWVNAACQGCGEGERLERFLAELEMKLQLVAEDVASQLEEHALASIGRIPRALTEVGRVEQDAAALQQAVSGIVRDLDAAEDATSQSVALLSAVDHVKARMEGARDTLQEAAGLADLLGSVEHVFQSGDPPRMAETLAAIRRSLDVVGDVPEFANGRQRVASLETRLEGLVQPALTEALSSRDAPRARELRDILLQVGRFATLERTYTATRLAPILGAWEGFGAGALGADPSNGAPTAAFAEWLPGFHNQVLLLVEEEVRWCASTFPEDHPSLLVHLLRELAAKTLSGFKKRATGAITAGGPAGALDALVSLRDALAQFAQEIVRLLGAASDDALRAIVAETLTPLEDHVRQYGELERSRLASELGMVDLSEGSGLEGTSRRLTDSVPAAVGILEGAVQRCISFTGGTESDALLKVLDDALLEYLNKLAALVKRLRKLLGLDAPKSSGGGAGKAGGPGAAQAGSTADGEEGPPATLGDEHVQGSLALLTVGAMLVSRHNTFEATVRSHLADVRTKLDPVLVDAEGADDPAPAPAPTADPATVRLAASPDRARRLRALLDNAADARYSVLPRATPRVAAVQDAIDLFVYDVLLTKVRALFHGVEELPEWNKEEEATPAGFEMPTFSAYANEYITNVGEYLLTLPQHLESLPEEVLDSVVQPDGTDSQLLFAEQWVVKVAHGASELYASHLLRIAALSERGAQQLAADVEYLCNVNAALSVTTPPKLAAMLVALQPPREQFQGALEEAEALDYTAAHVVARMRGLGL